MDLAPGELSTSKWIPGAASSLERHPTQQVSCGQTQEPLSLAWKKDQLLQNPAQGSRCLLAVVLKVGEGRTVEHSLLLCKASCYFQTYYAQWSVSEVASWPQRTPVEVWGTSLLLEYGFWEPADFWNCVWRTGGIKVTDVSPE